MTTEENSSPTKLQFAVEFIKKFLIAKLPSYFSPAISLRYFLYLSKAKRLLGKFDNLDKIKKSNSGFTLVFTDGNFIEIPQHERVSRFVSGRKHALSRILSQYHVSDFSEIRVDTVLDIGANIGEFSLACLEMGATKVYSVEPVLENFKCLEMNLLEFKFKSKRFQMALGAVNVDLPLYVAKERQNSSLIKPNNVESTVTVKCMRLDDFLEELTDSPIDLLKMDAEGFEPEVLSGLQSKLFRIRNYAIDCSPERENNDTIQQVTKFFELNRIKYRIRKSWNNSRIVIVAGENLSEV